MAPAKLGYHFLYFLFLAGPTCCLRRRNKKEKKKHSELESVFSGFGLFENRSLWKFGFLMLCVFSKSMSKGGNKAHDQHAE